MAQKTELALAGVPGRRHAFVAKEGDIVDWGETCQAVSRLRIAVVEKRPRIARAVERCTIARATPR